MKLVVTAKELRYGGRQMRAGDEFEASDKDARTLKAVRKAADAPPQVKRSMPAPPAPKPEASLAPKLDTRAMTPGEGTMAADEEQTRIRRRYGRRDMQAEE